MSTQPVMPFPASLSAGPSTERPREKLLVVDDERSIVEIFIDFFGEQGYEVDTAATGVEALDKIRAQEYDLIVTDINLPGADGLEVVRACKRRNQETGVLVMTGHATVN